jgi:acyl dehydratase
MYYEDVREGDTFKSTVQKPITGTEIDMVCQLSGLDHPNFLNPNRAKQYGFKDRVVPGAYTLACMFGMMLKQGFLADALWTQAESVSFKLPIFPGDLLSTECEVKTKKEYKRGGGFVSYHWKITNQDDKVVAEGENT